MESLFKRYDVKTASAWILGHTRRTGVPNLPKELIDKISEDCSDEELGRIVLAGQEAGLKLYPFKTGTQELARSRRTMGFLHSIGKDHPESPGTGKRLSSQ